MFERSVTQSCHGPRRRATQFEQMSTSQRGNAVEQYSGSELKNLGGPPEFILRPRFARTGGRAMTGRFSGTLFGCSGCVGDVR